LYQKTEKVVKGSKNQVEIKKLSKILKITTASKIDEWFFIPQI
jgi:hypothetical protein